VTKETQKNGFKSLACMSAVWESDLLTIPGCLMCFTLWATKINILKYITWFQISGLDLYTKHSWICRQSAISCSSYFHVTFIVELTIRFNLASTFLNFYCSQISGHTTHHGTSESNTRQIIHPSLSLSISSPIPYPIIGSHRSSHHWLIEAEIIWPRYINHPFELWQIIWRLLF
jgi:hypothetical protein